MVWPFWREFGRKLIHLLSFFFVLIYWAVERFFGHATGLLALVGLLVVLIELEHIRLEWHPKIPFLSKLWKLFKRPKEQKALGAEVFFLLGAIVCFAAFDRRVATAAVLMTTFGDFIAGLVMYVGRIPVYKYRKLEASIAELLVDIGVGWLFLRTSAWWLQGFTMTGNVLWIPVLLMAVTATVVETTTHKIDDNLVVPIAAGLVGHIALLILGIPLF